MDISIQRLLLPVLAKFEPTLVKVDRAAVALVVPLFGKQEITEPQKSSQDLIARLLCAEHLESCSGVMEVSKPAWLLK